MDYCIVRCPVCNELKKTSNKRFRHCELLHDTLKHLVAKGEPIKLDLISEKNNKKIEKKANKVPIKQRYIDEKTPKTPRYIIKSMKNRGEI